MKSTDTRLLSRGYAFDAYIQKCIKYDEEKLLCLLHDNEAYKRTIAVKLLPLRDRYIPLLCDMLETEKKLYTKIELCNTLVKYREKAIPYLIPLLGVIGNNQHKKPGLIDLKKRTYPLPRDICGRILIRIGPAVFPELKKLLLENINKKQIAEAIDVIGHIAWNHKNHDMDNILVEFYHKNREDEFLEWKIVRAFQSCVSEDAKTILKNIIETRSNKVIVEEAKRSLNRMNL